ncbi:NETI motif-containing protein [Bacillus carboniphilus]|uniref:NETI motif-containing protein n=1 Tax=Bacillus carboniphilus TaxID=86663 RepID=A0ABP3FYZ1_9BACI
MSKNPKKKWFTVLENETVSECLNRMDKEGYTPIRRLEKPVFEEIIKDGQKDVIPIKSEIQFQGQLKEE